MPYHFYEMDSFEREDLAAMPVPVGIEQLQALVRYVLMNARCRCRAHLCTYWLFGAVINNSFFAVPHSSKSGMNLSDYNS